MKALEQLTNVERARLLHELFPREIPALLRYVQGACETIMENQAAQRRQWQNTHITFDYWLLLLEDIETNIERYGDKLYVNAQLFSDQLFEGDLALFMSHCLLLYTKTREHDNKGFALAIELLFHTK